MRKILIISLVVTALGACNSNPDSSSETKNVVGIDSTAYKNNTMADTGHFSEAPVTNNLKETESVKEDKVVRKTSTKKAVTAPVIKETTTAPVTTTPAPVTTTPATTTESTTTTTTTPPVKEKKGWSSAAKDATIGGVGGAIGGAIISKKKGKGAIIGGALGAAGGYILGRKKDKKDAAAADTTQ